MALAIGVAFLLGWWMRGGDHGPGQDVDASATPSAKPPELRLHPEDVSLLPDKSLRWDYEGPESPEAFEAGAAGGNSGMDTSEERR